MAEQFDASMSKTPDLSSNAKAFRIGRFKSNDIVLDRETIDGHHALLILDGDRIIIEDLESASGTAVGTPTNRIQRAEVTENDRLFFGSFSIIATHLITMTKKRDNPTDSATSEKPTASLATKPPTSMPTVPIILGAACLLVLVAVIALMMSWRGDARKGVLTVDRFESSAASESIPDDERDSSRAAKLLAPQGESELAGPTAITEAADALFLLLSIDASSETSLQIGTAWLAAPDRLLTLASLVSDNRDKNANQPKRYQVVQSSTGKRFDVTKVSVSPRLSELESRYDAGRKKFEDLQSQIDALTDEADVDERLQTLKQEQQAVLTAGLQLKAQRAGINMAALTLGKPIDDADPTPTDRAASFTSGKVLHMHCCRCPGENVPYDDALLAEPFGIAVRVEERITAGPSDSPIRLVMRMKALSQPLNLLGSPILNQQGVAVAMFSDSLGERPSSSDPEKGELVFEAISLFDDGLLINQ
ncbi:MAG: FHA domain-containing protein [Pirellulaceae bacterium]